MQMPIKICHRSALVGLLFCLGSTAVNGQTQEAPIQTFGYFQVSMRHDESNYDDETANTFSVQQLNLIFQKDFSRQWSAFINFELINNFSSSRRWGSLDLDEAWLSYRANRHLSMKAGLHVPVFNHLNEIKNRTPLLPYIIRPLVYEESFAEIISIEEFVPNRAFLQASGVLPVGKAKLDYAGYLGNSPGINSQYENERKGVSQQTGVDTTTTVLVGGRVGLRLRDLKLGISGTREVVNIFRALAEPSGGARPLVQGISPDRFNGAVRRRLGADLSLHFNRFFLEGEIISVRYDLDVPIELKDLPDGSRPRIDLDRLFYYGTLGYEVNDRLLLYGSYWYTSQTFFLETSEAGAIDEIFIDVYSAGARYSMFQDENGFDRIALKAQYAYVPIDDGRPTVGLIFEEGQKIHFFALAISVLF